jgi:hypothetical protein
LSPTVRTRLTFASTAVRNFFYARKLCWKSAGQTRIPLNTLLHSHLPLLCQNNFRWKYSIRLLKRIVRQPRRTHGLMDCAGSRGFAICLRACDLIRELERKKFGVTDGPCRVTLLGKAAGVCGLRWTEDPAGTAAVGRRCARKAPGANGASRCRMGAVKRRLLGR